MLQYNILFIYNINIIQLIYKLIRYMLRYTLVASDQEKNYKIQWNLKTVRPDTTLANP